MKYGSSEFEVEYGEKMKYRKSILRLAAIFFIEAG